VIQINKIRKIENTAAKQIPLKEFVVAIEIAFKTDSLPFRRSVGCIGQIVSMSCQSGRFVPTFSLALYDLPHPLDIAVESEVQYAGVELAYSRSPCVDLVGDLKEAQKKLQPSPGGRYRTPTDQEVLRQCIKPLLDVQDIVSLSGVCCKCVGAGVIC